MGNLLNLENTISKPKEINPYYYTTNKTRNEKLKKTPERKWIILTDQELQSAKNESRERCFKFGQNDSFRIDNYLGVKGEIAVSKQLKIPYNSEIYKKGGDKGKPDLYYNNFGIEVKCTDSEYFSPHLMFDFNEESSADFYVLCCAHKPKSLEDLQLDQNIAVGIWGFIQRNHYKIEREIIKIEKYNSLKIGVHCSKLLPIVELPNYSTEIVNLAQKFTDNGQLKIL